MNVAPQCLEVERLIDRVGSGRIRHSQRDISAAEALLRAASLQGTDAVTVQTRAAAWVIAAFGLGTAVYGLAVLPKYWIPVLYWLDQARWGNWAGHAGEVIFGVAFLTGGLGLLRQKQWARTLLIGTGIAWGTWALTHACWNLSYALIRCGPYFPRVGAIAVTLTYFASAIAWFWECSVAVLTLRYLRNLSSASYFSEAPEPKFFGVQSSRSIGQALAILGVERQAHSREEVIEAESVISPLAVRGFLAVERQLRFLGQVLVVIGCGYMTTTLRRSALTVVPDGLPLLGDGSDTWDYRFCLGVYLCVGVILWVCGRGVRRREDWARRALVASLAFFGLLGGGYSVALVVLHLVERGVTPALALPFGEAIDVMSSCYIALLGYRYFRRPEVRYCCAKRSETATPAT